MFGTVDMKHPKLARALFQKARQRKGDGEHRENQSALPCGATESGIDGKARRKPKISGYGRLANRLDCSAGGGSFANDSRSGGVEEWETV
jgi:hypothetical protein